MYTLRRCINLQIIWCIVDVVDTIAPALTIEQAARTGLNPKTPAPAEARRVEDYIAGIRSVLEHASRNFDLRKWEHKVLVALIDHACDGIAQLSRRQLADMTGLSLRSVETATARLIHVVCWHNLLTL